MPVCCSPCLTRDALLPQPAGLVRSPADGPHDADHVLGQDGVGGHLGVLVKGQGVRRMRRLTTAAVVGSGGRLLLGQPVPGSWFGPASLMLPSALSASWGLLAGMRAARPPGGQHTPPYGWTCPPTAAIFPLAAAWLLACGPAPAPRPMLQRWLWEPAQAHHDEHGGQDAAAEAPQVRQLQADEACAGIDAAGHDTACRAPQCACLAAHTRTMK